MSTNRGLTLVEVLLGSVLMSLVLGLFFTLFRQASQSLSRQTEELTAQHSFIQTCDAIEKSLSRVATFSTGTDPKQGHVLQILRERDDREISILFKAGQGAVIFKAPGEPERPFLFYEKKPEEVKELRFTSSQEGDVSLVHFSATIEQASRPLTLYRTFRVRPQIASGTVYFPKVKIDD